MQTHHKYDLEKYVGVERSPLKRPSGASATRKGLNLNPFYDLQSGPSSRDASTLRLR